MYHKPYPEAYDQIALPHRYRVLDFTKFSRQNSMSTVEHISRFLIQCGECRNRCSEDSFGGTLAVWIGLCMVLRLACKFQYHMADLKMQCHKYFFAGVHEMKLTDLTSIV